MRPVPRQQLVNDAVFFNLHLLLAWLDKMFRLLACSQILVTVKEIRRIDDSFVCELIFGIFTGVHQGHRPKCNRQLYFAAHFFFILYSLLWEPFLKKASARNAKFGRKHPLDSIDIGC